MAADIVRAVLGTNAANLPSHVDYATSRDPHDAYKASLRALYESRLASIAEQFTMVLTSVQELASSPDTGGVHQIAAVLQASLSSDRQGALMSLCETLAQRDAELARARATVESSQLGREALQKRLDELESRADVTRVESSAMDAARQQAQVSICTCELAQSSARSELAACKLEALQSRRDDEELRTALEAALLNEAALQARVGDYRRQVQQAGATARKAAQAAEAAVAGGQLARARVLALEGECDAVAHRLEASESDAIVLRTELGKAHDFNLSLIAKIEAQQAAFEAELGRRSEQLRTVNSQLEAQAASTASSAHDANEYAKKVEELAERLLEERRTVSRLLDDSDRLSAELRDANAANHTAAETAGGLRANVASLESFLAARDAAFLALQQRVGEFDSHKTQLQGSLESVAKQRDAALAQTRELGAALGSAESRLAEAVEARSVTEARAAELQAALTGLQARLFDGHSENLLEAATLRAECDALRAPLTDAEAEAAQREGELAVCRDEARQLRSVLETTARAHAGRIEQLHAALDEKNVDCSEARIAADYARALVDALTRDLEEARSRLDSQQALVPSTASVGPPAVLCASVGTLPLAFTDASVVPDLTAHDGRASLAELTSVRTDLATARDRLQTLDGERGALTSLLASLQTARDGLQAQLESLQQAHSALLSEFDASKAAASASAQQARDLEVRLESDCSSHVAAAAALRSEMSSQFRALQQRVIDFSADHEALQDRESQLAARNSELSSALVSAREESTALRTSFEAFNARLTRAESELEISRAEATAASARHRSVSDELAQCRARLDASLGEAQAALSQSASLDASLRAAQEAFDAERSNFTRELSASRNAQLLQVRGDVQRAQQSNSALERDARRFMEEAVIATARATAAERQSASLQSEVTCLRFELTSGEDAWRARLDAAQDEGADLKAALSDVQSRAQRAELRALDADIREDQLRKQLSDADSQLASHAGATERAIAAERRAAELEEAGSAAVAHVLGAQTEAISRYEEQLTLCYERLEQAQVSLSATEVASADAIAAERRRADAASSEAASLRLQLVGAAAGTTSASVAMDSELARARLDLVAALSRAAKAEARCAEMAGALELTTSLLRERTAASAAATRSVAWTPPRR